MASEARINESPLYFSLLERDFLSFVYFWNCIGPLKEVLLLTSETDDGVLMTWTCVDLAEEIVNSFLAQWRELLNWTFMIP